MDRIDTGYKPEFALGAVYHGQNAADLDMGNQLEVVKRFLANQREQQMQPLDVQVREWEAAHAQDKIKSDAYRQASLDGYIGQMQSQIAAGKKAKETVDNDIALSNATSQNEQWTQNLLKRLHDLRTKRLDGSGAIGFPMQTEEAQYADPAGNGDLVKTGGKPLLMATQPGINRNNSPLTPQPPKRQDAMLAGTPEEELIMSMLINDPKHRQQRDLIDIKQDSAEYMKMLQLQMALQAAQTRAAGDKPPSTFEGGMVRLALKKARGEQLTPEEETVFNLFAGGFDAKNAAKIQPGVTVNPNVAPNVLEKKPEQKQAPRLGNDKPDPLGIR